MITLTICLAWTRGCVSLSVAFDSNAVADFRGVRGVQMHPPLVASNVFLLTTRHSYTLTYQFLTDLQTFV